MDWEQLVPIAGAGISSVGNFAGQSAANKANIKLQQTQLDWNENMWHMNNQYNTPEAQMNRMQDAGLNPLLALGGMGGGNSGSPADAVAPAQMDNTMAGFDPVGSYMRIKQASADVENKELLNEQQISKNEYQELMNAKLEQDIGRGGIAYKGEKADYEENRKQAQLKTTMMMTENLLKNQNYNKNAIELAWMDWEKRLNTLKGIKDIQMIDNKIKLNNQEWQHIKDNGYKIPSKIIGGMFTKYVMGTMKGKIEQNKGKILKTVNEVLTEAVDSYWKNYNPEEQKNKDWRTKPRVFKGHQPYIRPGY